MDELVSKAAVLHEALPYIRRFRRHTFVVKYGGHAMLDAPLKESFARDVCLLRYVGIQLVVVHGGGPQINQTLQRMGIQPAFSGGLRITDAETMAVVEMVLGGTVNQSIFGLISQHGGRAVGLSGKDDACILAKQKPPVAGTASDGSPLFVDLGRVGQIQHVNPELLHTLLEQGFIPVLAPIASDADGRTLNVNADEAAAEIAAALKATKLMLMTDVEGVRDGQGQLLRSLRARHAEQLIEQQIIAGGMIPKVRCALNAVDHGVEKVHIVDGRARHALLLEIFTDQGVGTEIQRLQSP